MNAFTRNPEFRRNLWLECSPQRLALMPLVILLALFVIGNFGPDNDEGMWGVILSLSVVGFAGLTIVWGCVQAGNALRHEFSDGTWDSQRMSNLTPWQMVWGKLLGGSFYAWYGGGIFLLTALFAATQVEWRFIDALRGCLGLVLLALLAQALSMMKTLLFWQRRPGRTQGPIGAIGSLILIWFLAGGLFSFIGKSYRVKMTQGGIEIFWYGMEMGVDFMLLSLFVLVAWVVAGLWQRMRRELLLRNRPWWWLAFLLFWISWSAGFFTREAEKVWTFFFAAWAALTWMSGYALIFSEKKDAAFWIRFRAAWKRRDGELLQHLLPNWIVSFALALVLTFIALSLSGSGSFFRGLLCLVSLTAFVLRDTAWILWLNLKPGARHPDGAALVSLAVAYGVLPWIDARLFLPMMNVKRRWWSLSSWDFSSNATALALAIQILFAAVTLWLLHNRFRETFGKGPGIRDR